MANSDLLKKQTVMDTMQSVFMKHKIAFKPEGDVEQFGFCAELPKAVNDLKPEYDVEQVIQNIKDGQSLNIPHQGYCMNKDIALQIIRSGWCEHEPEYVKTAEEVSDDIDKAIQFMSNRTFCDNCEGGNCPKCGRYIAKKYTLTGLYLYRQINEILKRLEYLKDNSSSEDEAKYYSNVSDMINEAITSAIDTTHMM